MEVFQFPSPSSSRTVNLCSKIHFLTFNSVAFHSGGLEILFSNERKHTIHLPAQLNNGSRPNIAYLLQHLVDNVMKDLRKELFIMEDNVYVNQRILIKAKLTVSLAGRVSLY